MRVNSTIHHPAQTADAGAAKKAGKTDQADSRRNDRASAPQTTIPGSVNAEISSRGRELARAKSVAESAPDIREGKIAELKQRIAAGKYNVSPEAISDRLVDEHLSTSGLS
ncbi:MAG: flagellar biosynthesis anti-sigma factor FlgM [Bdellovibrionales bacterium GWB1_55_8]|nr:MAG: flagellar biosynthesis anti-sigma factor FlgM [Bdellovibrionales bacterium GWB1_55_8]